MFSVDHVREAVGEFRSVRLFGVGHPVKSVADLHGGDVVAVEWCFLVLPSLADGWERRGVPAVAIAVTVGLFVARTVSVALGAAAWGLVTYGALLACVLAGLGNLLARLPGVDG